MSHYTDIQYKDDLPRNAKRDLNILFFDDVFKHSKRILDIGCSKGNVISMYPDKMEGIDIDEKAIYIANRKGLKVQYADVTKRLPFPDNSFDGIFCSQLIEHLYEPLELLKEVRRILKKDSTAVFITPDYIKTSRKYHKGFWSDYTHKTPFIPESLKKISYDAGFKIHKIYPYPGKGFRNLMRYNIITKDTWTSICDSFFVWSANDLILEVTK